MFSLHPLAVEDALKAHQRPKLERYDDGLFLVLKTLWYVDEEDAVETGEINLFVGRNFVVSVRHGEGTELHSARLDLEEQTAVLGHGPSAVRLRDLRPGRRRLRGGGARRWRRTSTRWRTSVFSPDRTQDSQRIYILKRELAEMRRAVDPLREPMKRFATGSVPFVTQEAAPFFRDVADHVHPGLGGHRDPRQPAVHGVRRAPGADQRPAERGHAEDLGLGGDRRRRHARRRHLRHELRQHARAALALRLLLRARR